MVQHQSGIRVINWQMETCDNIVQTLNEEFIMKQSQSVGRCMFMLVGIIAAAMVLFSAGPVQAASVLNSCTFCHGMPPKDGARKANPHYNSLSSAFSGNHQTHATGAADCSICHTAVAPTAFGHQNEQIEFLANINNSPATGQYKVSGAAITFKNQTSIPVLGSCSNVNCHFESNTLTWGSTPFTSPTDCDKCHANTLISSARHTIHTAKYACTQCHYDHAAAVKPFAHATSAGQRAIKVVFTAAPNNGTGSYSDTSIDYLPSQVHTYGTCNTLYCHSSGNINNAGAPVAPTTYTNPNWNTAAVGGCSVCHGDGLAAGKAHPVYASGAVASATANSHVKHVEDSALSCDFCHNSTTTSATIPPTTVLAVGAHLNRTDDVSFKPNGGKTGTYAPAGKTCSTTYCHGTGPSVGWGGATTCVSCHDATSALMLRHDKHYNSATPPAVLAGGADAHTASAYVYTCLACHPSTQHSQGPASAVVPLQDAAVSGTKITTYTKGTGVTTTDARGFNYTTNGTCATVCHTKDGVTAASAVVTQNWGTAATGSCGVCHSKAGDAVPTWSAPHTRHINTYAANTNNTCEACHTGTAASNTALQATIAARNQHPNAVKNVAFGTFAGGTWSGTQCSNTYCHSNGTAAVGVHAVLSWSGSMNAECSSCHGGNSTATTKITTNTHGVHTNDTANVIGFSIGCVECHSATVSSDRVIGSIANHVNKNVNVRFDNGTRNKDTDAPTYNTSAATSVTAGGASKAAGSAVASCANVYCHSSGNVNNAGAAVAPATFKTIAWNAAAIGCSGCHGDGLAAGKAHPVYASGAIASATANSHVKHVEDSALSCDFCHNSTTTSATIPPTTVLAGGAHLNRTDDVSFKTNSGKTGTYAPATKTCSTTYCHGTGPSVGWGGATTCVSCHDATSALMLRHDKHYNSTTPPTVFAGGADAHTASAYVYTCLACHPSTQHSQGPASAVVPLQDAAVSGTKITTYTKGTGVTTTDARGFNYTTTVSYTHLTLPTIYSV